MPKRKLEIKATEEQLNELYHALDNGAPLEMALQKVGISLATYYYWCAVASIVMTVQSQEEIEDIESIAKTGISVQDIRDKALNEAKTRKTGIGAYVEPSAESMLLYRNSLKFKKFANRCYDIVINCNKARINFATIQLKILSASADIKRKLNPSPSMWWLERNMPDFFAKPTDKAKENENAAPTKVPSIEVEFIEPNTKEQRQRLLEMESDILANMKGGGVKA